MSHLVQYLNDLGRLAHIVHVDDGLEALGDEAVRVVKQKDVGFKLETHNGVDIGREKDHSLNQRRVVNIVLDDVTFLSGKSWK